LSKFFILCFILIFIGCGGNKSSGQSEAYYRGEKIYRTVCLSCHNLDPRKVGALAPDIAGSDLELIRSMIMTGKHPEGRIKKWPEHQMAALPNLKDKIPDLHEYLKTFK
tara:strand:+ start:1718 stop:2044 length:327 start_codon:yes stop_codon:yes gene_type:complete